MHVLRILVMSLSNVSLYMLTKVVAFVAYIVPISMLMLLTGEMICLHTCLWLSCVLYTCNPCSLSLSLSLSCLLCKHCISFLFREVICNIRYIWRDAYHPLCHCLCFTCTWINIIVSLHVWARFYMKMFLFMLKSQIQNEPCELSNFREKLVILNVTPKVTKLSRFGLNNALALWRAHHWPLE